MGIGITRVNSTVTIDGSSTAALAGTRAFLVGKDTEEPGKPILFVRKRLDDITSLGGVLYENGEKPERLVFVSPNPVQVTTSRYLAVGVTGYQNVPLLLEIIISKSDHIGETPSNGTIPRKDLTVQNFLYGKEFVEITRQTSKNRRRYDPAYTVMYRIYQKCVDPVEIQSNKNDGQIAAAVTNPLFLWGLLLVMVIDKFCYIGETPSNRTIPREVVIDPVETKRRTSYIYDFSLN